MFERAPLKVPAPLRFPITIFAVSIRFADIVPVVTRPPSIVVLPEDPKSPACTGVVLSVPSVKVPPLNTTTPVKLVCFTTFE